MTARHDPPLPLISSFVGPRCAGNAHRVRVADRLLTEGEAQPLSRRVAPAILVDIAGSGEDSMVRFYQFGREIQDCGSGLVAAAFLTGRAASTLESRRACNELFCSGNLCGYRRRVNLILQPARPHLAALGRQLCRTEPLAVHRAKGGYLIIELARATEVAGLQPRLGLLQTLGRAALIVTAPVAAGERRRLGGARAVLRYFAPQWGNPEDPATGSAAMLVTQYWWRRLGQPGGGYLQLRQLSASGGLIYGRVDGGRVSIAGRCGVTASRTWA